MQEGSVIREHRKLGPDVWSYRWWGIRSERQLVDRAGLGLRESILGITSWLPVTRS
jgi:hypothetical protein